MNVVRRAGGSLLLGLLLISLRLSAQTPTGTPLRIMSANLNGNTQVYQPFALRIFQGLKPDVVAIQEFNYGNNTPADFRAMLDTAFGTNFVYYRESGYNIPNGIISRYPILASGSWDDPLVADRGFAWAQVNLPGSNDLYVVSVHLYGSGSSTDRNTEATLIRDLIGTNFPANAWVVVAGDFNTSTRTETAISTFKTFLSDSPIPTDAESGGDADTNEPRNKPYDYVLPSHSLATMLTNCVFASHSFSNGLVFDSRAYTPLSDVAPVQAGDSTNAQHMAVIKDFALPYGITPPLTDAPTITGQPQSLAIGLGSDATFSVVANGAALAYQWRFNGDVIYGATAASYIRTAVQTTDAGNYSVVITNASGSAMSLVATLTVITAPLITAQPQNQTVRAGQNAAFSVSATGATPMSYQWRFKGVAIPDATASSYTRANVQTTDAGAYSVIVSNAQGTTTSADAVLSVIPAQSGTVIAQWDFNSVPADGSTTSGTTSPSVGSGTAALVGGTTQTFAGGSTIDPAASGTNNSGWNTANYPAQGTANKTAGVQFNVSTLGRENLVLRWDQKESNTGSKYVRLQYSTNGTTFVDYPSATGVASTSFEAKTNTLSGVPGVANNANFAFRIVAEFESTATGAGSASYAGAGGTYGTGGTVRFDMVTVSGTTIPVAPPAPANLSGFNCPSNGSFQFALTGTTGAKYVIQAATDLSLGDWVSLLTNAAPFTFNETNGGSASCRFYRAVALP